MYLNIMNNKKTGKTTLSIRKGYRDSNGKVKHSTIQTLGSLDILKQQYDDPISYFKDVVKKMNEEEKNNNSPLTLTINKNEKLLENTDNKRNFGYVALSKIYHELEIDKFLINKFKARKFSEFKINNIMKLLVFARALFPDSKKSTFENKDIFFENNNFSLEEVYNALTYIEPYKEQLQQYIYEHIQEQYKPNNESIFYDVTNYYFEIDDNDNFRKKGVCKEHRPNPIVQMGLFMDSLGLPMCYKLFAGNTTDCLTLKPMIQELQKNYNVGRVIVVADKGLNTGNNIAYNLAIGNGYVMSLSIRGANKDLKDYVLNEDGYQYNSDKTYKKKSRKCPREIIITKKDKNGKTIKTKQNIDEHQVVFWSADYAKRAKAERQPAIDKAKDLIDNIQKYNKKNCVGASKYVKHLVFDKNTGEIIEAESQLSLDEDKIAEEEKLDGYYMIVSSEFEKTPDEIIDIYRGLWRIEETFKVTKSELDSRPVYVSTKEHIEAHFLTCYLALTLSRVLQHKLDKKYSVGKILESLSLCNCYCESENIYLFNYYDSVLKDIGNVLNIDFSLKRRTLQDIKNFLALSKK
ncbi:MAG: IS1634 family transposase [Clostridia bacterium]|nr:IS1634 family transposase [Clostridia bacterium]